MNPNGNFLVYKSSAGSGKTYTLVKEYLLIALSTSNSDRYKNILAITFTNKAASEMKDRVTSYLKVFTSSNIISGGESLMFNSLKNELDLSDEKLKQRAFKMLQSILHNYSDFNITTIDKFILRIIRSFSFDLKLPYNFEVELDSDSLLNQAINNLLAEAGKDKKITAFLVNYIKNLAKNDESWNIQSGLLKVAKVSLNEDALPHLKKIQNLKLDDFSRIKESLRQEIQNYEEFILNKYKRGKELLQNNEILPIQLKGKSKKNIWAYFNSKKTKKTFEEKAADSYFDYIINEDWCNKGFEQSIPIEVQEELRETFVQIEDYKQQYSGDYILKHNVHKHIFQLGLLNELEKKVNQIREEQNFIHISEFNKKVAEIVIQQPIPFIYERIGEKFDNYLIDEFQDTSILQWQNLLPLLENSLAYNNKNLIVGDAKQAIYRWRGGDIDQFTLLPDTPHFKENEIIQERIKTLKRQFNPQHLEYNYRSKKEVIEFNNLFFRELLNKLPEYFKPYYNEYEQKIGIEKTGGYAQIKVLPNLSDEDTTLNYILDSINDCLKRGKELNEIAILTRKNNELTLIAEFLTQHKIPVISNESLNLNQSKEINFLVNFYACILDNNNIEAIVQSCKFLNTLQPLDYFSIFNSKHPIYETFKHIIESQYRIQLPSVTGISVYEIFEELILAFKINKSDPFIQTFLDLVREKSSRINGADFVDFWMDKKESLKIASPQKIKAVTLMTIHKSKGLEFPIVILPFANKPPNRSSWLWLKTDKEKIGIGSALTLNSNKLLNTTFSKESEEEKLKGMLDELNVIYVALTRAENEIYVSIKEEKDSDSIKGVEKYFHQVLPKLNEEDENIFSYGKKTSSVKPTDKTLEQKPIPEKNLTAGDWRKKIKMSFSAPKIWDVPKTSEEHFPAMTPKTLGNIIHDAFANLKHSSEVESVIHQMFEEGFIEKDKKDLITSALVKTLKLKPIHEIWDLGDHIIEKEIITKEGISYRPDRIIQHNSITYLIDFKTGEEKKSDKKQILNYESLLKELNFTNVQSFLIYTDKGISKQIN
ncbi:MAG: hypothetical protein CMP67_10770 [Flavobacteriales bacterium]|nr:hypothetical protein [Flavobacteriales bacterium]|tara:strand:- start:45667 stop:48810 length:3144 start_codon:yes stop_codon:yes gene_type:complete